MKKATIFIIVALLTCAVTLAQNPSAILELESTSQGLLPPVMTKDQMNSITSPAVGLMVFCTDCHIIGPHFYSGAAWIGPDNLPHDLASTDVYNPATGKVWMDRNLGASQVATSSTDADAYGTLYQWGRNTDGHQIKTSATTGTPSSVDAPGHGYFIFVGTSSPYDWRSPQNDNLWQGVSGINNPCPTGYRLPTEAEWEAELMSWSSNDAAGAFASYLKLSLAGYRNSINGVLSSVGFLGNYWSSSIDDIYARDIFITGAITQLSSNRAYGESVRCIKD